MTEDQYSVDVVLRLAKEGIEANRVKLAPDEDISPVLLGLTTGSFEIIGFVIDPEPGMKDALIYTLRKIIQARRFKAVALITSVWMVAFEGLTEQEKVEAQERWEAGTMPSEEPLRQEAVVIQSLDAEVMRFEYAFLTRQEDEPPLLSEWHQFPADGEVEGRFAELHDALR